MVGIAFAASPRAALHYIAVPLDAAFAKTKKLIVELRSIIPVILRNKIPVRFFYGLLGRAYYNVEQPSAKQRNQPY